ncbi:hypothetical protein D3C76_1502980 [compost metagenome]
MNALIQASDVIVFIDAAQADDQADQGHGGIAQRIPGQTAQVELRIKQTHRWGISRIGRCRVGHYSDPFLIQSS